MTQPTAAAMRAAVKLDQIWGHDGDEVTRRCASEIDHATGLPELIDAASDVYAVLVELMTNDTSAHGNKFYAPDPQQGERLHKAHGAISAALRIAREGRS